MNRLRSQSGQLSLDFLFAIILILATAAFISTLAIGLTLVEVAQYVSFSGARSYLAGDLRVGDQENAAKAQVDNLVKNLPFLNGAISNRWISLKPLGPGNYKKYAEAKGADTSGDNFEFVGYQLEVTLSLLTFTIPLLGDLVQAPSGNDVKATVSSFLMREPSFDECLKLNEQAYQSVLAGDTSYQKAKSNPANFKAINDNGC